MRANRTTLAVGGAVAALGLGAVGVDAATRHGAPAATFQQRLAQRLGVSSDKLAAATRAAADDTVAQLRSDGRIDARRADALKRRIQRTGAAPFARLGRPPAPGRGAALAAEAKALGIDRAALVRELRAGRSPADVIAAHGKDRAEVAAAVKAAVRAQLAKRLAADRADAIAQRVADRLTGTQALKRR
jgi:hypothetical protein